MEQGSLSDDVVSMVDVLQEDKELEEEANAVLGDSDDQHCTYPKGFVNRQALYACSTCTPSSTEPAGVCLACCLTCHENHELFELYTKRNFQCDCGNSKFGDFKCKLYPDKDSTNSSNSYNQNFHGVYCTCHKPYPDPDDEIEDEMIQCVVCEDWYHSRHLGCLPPAGGDYQEMICDSCMDKCPFLQAYLSLSVPSISTLGPSQQVVTKEENTSNVDISTHENKKTETDEGDKQTQDDKDKPDKPLTNGTEKEEKPGGDVSSSEQDAALSASTDCKLIPLQATVTEIKKGPSFWNVGWRSQLCKCTSCTPLYSSLGVSFLADDQDSLVAYEERGQASQAAKGTSYESGMQALSGMGRINQVEAIHEYNDMKNELTEYLRDFADQGKVVAPEDIKSFFESMQSRKRQRTGSASTVQYSCK